MGLLADRISPPAFQLRFQLLQSPLNVVVSLSQIISSFSESIGNGLSMSNHVGRGKTAYIWISLDPAKVGPTLKIVVVFIE